MSIHGPIRGVRIVTCALECQMLAMDEHDLIEFVQNKHIYAERNDKYVVEIDVLSAANGNQVVKIYSPKSIMDNGLIEKGTQISCSSDECSITIEGHQVNFERAYNRLSTT